MSLFAYFNFLNCCKKFRTSKRHLKLHLNKNYTCQKTMVSVSFCGSVVFMYICTYVHMYVCTYVRMYICTYVHMYVCTYVHMYVGRFVHM
jgi:hypothetical protein